MRRAEIDRAVFEVDDDPVKRLRHDLHGLDAGNGGYRTEGRASLPPLLPEAVEGRRRWRGQSGISTGRFGGSQCSAVDIIRTKSRRIEIGRTVQQRLG
jgi:hypothetical protein